MGSVKEGTGTVGSAGNVSAGQVKDRGVDYTCDICGSHFHSGRARSGERICSVCIELRRAVIRTAKTSGLEPAEIGKRLLKMRVIALEAKANAATVAA